MTELLHRGLEAEEATADDEALQHIADRAGGDGRAALGALEVAVALAGAVAAPPHVTLAEAEAALDARFGKRSSAMSSSPSSSGARPARARPPWRG